MGFSQIKKVSLKKLVYLKKRSVSAVFIFTMRAHLFTKEHPRSQDCIRTSDDLKMRLEKPILFARADNVGFSQINRVFLKNPTLCADNVGFFRETYFI